MSDQTIPTQDEYKQTERIGDAQPVRHHRQGLAIKALVLLVVFALGAGSGYMFGNQRGHAKGTAGTATGHEDTMTLMEQVNPPEGYKISAAFGNVGPQLVAAGAIDLTKFIGLYKQQNKPLTSNEMAILNEETTGNIVFTPENAYFLLNFFWALGLTNQNDILTSGPMMSGGIDKVGGYASTGGWTLGTRKATELFSSTKIMALNDEQQARLLEVASGVYRQCCNNPTHFPDCNHGMAMLGLLELMASQDATVDQMYDAAKYVNAFWYPQQMLELATAFKAADKVDFSQADARKVVSSQYSSLSGFQAVHQWLSQNGLLDQAPSGGGSCGVK